MLADEHINSNPEILLLAALKTDSHEAFVEIFRLHYRGLVMFCNQFIESREVCEDIVQDIFVKLWEERKSLEIRRSLKSYLTILVQNRALDELRRAKVKANYASSNNIKLLALSPEEHMFYSELNEALDKAIGSLPETERETLLLSMNHRLTYPQIAEKLGVSLRTVETRISKALKSIRSRLSVYRPLMLSTAALMLTSIYHLF